MSDIDPINLPGFRPYDHFAPTADLTTVSEEGLENEAVMRASAHIARLMDQYGIHRDFPDTMPQPTSPSGASYCGCVICVSREVLWAASPVIEEMLRRCAEGEDIE